MKKEALQRVEGQRRRSALSPLELIRKTGGVAHQVKSPAGRAVDSMLAVYRDKLTFTFVIANEVASIHFDRTRKEIFFSGHNVMHMDLKAEHVKALKALQGILSEDEQGKLLFTDYVATLAHILADKDNRKGV